MEEIKSLKDSRLQKARSLNTLKGRMENRGFLVERAEAISWAIESRVDIEYLLVTRESRFYNGPSLAMPVYCLSDGLIKKVTATNYVIPEVAVAKGKAIEKKDEFVLVLDDVRDFGNIGTIVRTAHAFDINTIYSSKKEMDLYNRKCVDASRGRVFDTELARFDGAEDTVAYLRKKGYQIITTSPYGTSVQSMVTLSDKPVALIVGNETDGVSKTFVENADSVVQIPMHSQIESLNVGVATGISIYELRLKQVIGMIDDKIKNTLGRDINVSAMLVQSVLDKNIRKVSELSARQFVFMMVLKCDITMSLGSMQQQFGVIDSELQDFLQPLLEKKYIDYAGTGAVSITDTGIEVLGKLWSVVENTEKEILKDFSEEEQKQLHSLIGRLNESCSALLKG